MRLFLCPLFLRVFFIFYSCAENVESNEEDISEFKMSTAKELINEKTRFFTEAHINKDTAFLNNLFAKDGRILPPNSEVVNGRKAIAQLNFD